MHQVGSMMDPQSIIEARHAGEVRYVVLSDFSDDMDRVLSRFGLVADGTLLVEYNRETALSILTELLWRDMAYRMECMSEPEARKIAQEIISQNEYAGSKYYSNGNWAKRESWNPLTDSTLDARRVIESRSWNPLTDSTFDGGLIITGPNHRYFCLWFQDED
jgi:hypothetical protein